MAAEVLAETGSFFARRTVSKHRVSWPDRFERVLLKLEASQATPGLKAYEVFRYGCWHTLEEDDGSVMRVEDRFLPLADTRALRGILLRFR